MKTVSEGGSMIWCMHEDLLNGTHDRSYAKWLLTTLCAGVDWHISYPLSYKNQAITPGSHPIKYLIIANDITRRVAGAPHTS